MNSEVEEKFDRIVDTDLRKEVELLQGRHAFAGSFLEKKILPALGDTQAPRLM